MATLTLRAPPQEAPKKLTARAYPTNKRRGEHIRAFLAANNLSGFVDDAEEEADIQNPETVVQLLMQMLVTKEFLDTELRFYAGEFRRFFPPGKIKQTLALHLLARVIGYNDWEHAKSNSVPTGVMRDNGQQVLRIANRNYGHEVSSLENRLTWAIARSDDRLSRKQRQATTRWVIFPYLMRFPHVSSSDDFESFEKPFELLDYLPD